MVLTHRVNCYFFVLKSAYLWALFFLFKLFCLFVWFYVTIYVTL